MNHTNRRPYIPLPPPLPRFPSASPASSAARAAAPSAARPRLIVRKKKPVVDATEEVELEDILLEAYAEDPPPPLPAEDARASIAMAIASVVSHGGHAGMQGADYETPSLAPVMLSTAAPPSASFDADAASANAAALRANRRHGFARVASVAIWSVVIIVISVAAAAAIVVGVRNGTYARLRDGARSAAARASSKHDAPIAAAAPPAAPAAPAPAALAPALAPAADAVPTFSVDALPKSPIPPDASLVTFPAYARGHRVFVDGRVIAVVEGTPTPIRCGRHTLKIGSARKPRVLDFACGREVIVE